MRARFIPAALAAALTMITATAGLAQGAGTDAVTEQQVAGILKHNAGSKRIGANAVELEPGVVMRVHPGATAALSPSACSLAHGASVGWLCLYQNSNWGGAEIDFTVCTDRNLGTYNMGNGVPWNDQVSSIDNDQTSQVQSRFYNYDGTGDPNSSSNWRFVLALNAQHYLRDLSKDTSADGGTANDKIDIVHVC